MHNRIQSTHSKRYLAAAGLVILVLVSFVLQSFVFTSEYRPDEWRAIQVFLENISGSSSMAGEIWVRACLTLFNVVVVAALYTVRLIDDRTILLALVWPLALFLFSKIYWEFFVFPLCLIRFDLEKRQELVVIAALLGLLLWTGEGNLAVLLVWRCALLAQNFGLRKTTPIALVGIGATLDVLMTSGVAKGLPLIGQGLARFSWTRDIINPEYSILETVAVFVSSFHFFSLHTGAYWIDAIFSVIVLGVIFNSKESWEHLRKHFWTVLAFVSVVLMFTSITHAFQNARYYFFFLPVLAAIIPVRKLPALGVLGVLHVGIRAFSL